MDLSTDYFFKTQTLSTRKWVIFLQSQPFLCFTDLEICLGVDDSEKNSSPDFQKTQL